jgi:hypothetical protein
MDYANLPTLTPLSDAERRGFFDWLETHYADTLRHVRGDAQKLQHAVAAYRAFAEKIGLPADAARSFFRTNILPLAHYPAAEADTALAFYDEDPDSPASPLPSHEDPA